MNTSALTLKAQTFLSDAGLRTEAGSAVLETREGDPRDVLIIPVESASETSLIE